MHIGWYALRVIEAMDLFTCFAGNWSFTHTWAAPAVLLATPERSAACDCTHQPANNSVLPRFNPDVVAAAKQAVHRARAATMSAPTSSSGLQNVNSAHTLLDT
jgi:hypothetical protein